MTRNHFSKKGGPYFISDGFSKHIDKPSKPAKPAIKVWYKVITILAFLLAIIGSVINSL